MSVERPYTLTLTQANNPHRTAPNTHVPQSYLEESFSRGNLSEIEYWIQSGVVAQALSGQSKSRRDYATSLMEFFSLWLAEQHLVSDRERISKVIEVLWEGGAKDKVERHATWLARMISWPLADRLLDMGVNPWESARVLEIRHMSGSSKRYVRAKTHHEHKNAMIAGLNALAYAEKNINDHLGIDKSQLSRLTARIQRMFLGSHTPERDDLQQALGLVVRGGLQAELDTACSRGGEQAPGKTDQQQRVAQWATWRDLLLARDARALMYFGDGLDELILAAPSEPLSRWHIHNIEHNLAQALRKEQALAQGKEWWDLPLPKLADEQANEIMLDQLGRRALGWQRAAHAWLDALDGAMSRALDEWDRQKLHYGNGAASGERWGKLLDAPGGLDLVKRMASKLSARGQALPWSPLNRSLANARTHDLVTYKGYRSMRRLDLVKQLLADPALTQDGVLPAWRADLAHSFLKAEAGEDTPQSPCPGLRLDGEESRKPRLYRYNTSELGLPTESELDLLLDLAGPDVMGFDQLDPKINSDAHWVMVVFSQLPDMWKQRSVPAKDQQALLDVLARRGVLDKIMAGLTAFSTGALSKLSSDSLHTMEHQGDLARNSWLKHWKKVEVLPLLEQTLQRHCTPESQQVLDRLLAWDRVVNNKSVLSTRSVEELERDDRVLGRVAQDCPSLIDRMAGVLARRIGSESHNGGWDNIMYHLVELNMLATLGWEPQEESDPSEMIFRALAEQRPTEEQQQQALELLKSLGAPDEVGGALLTSLMEHEDQAGTDRTGWKESIDPLINAGASPSISGQPLVSGTLRGHIVSSIRRRQLADVAQQDGVAEGPDITVPKRRF